MHSPHCTPELLGLSVLVGSAASGHRGPAQTAGDGNRTCTWRWMLVICLARVSTIWCSLYGICVHFVSYSQMNPLSRKTSEVVLEIVQLVILNAVLLVSRWVWNLPVPQSSGKLTAGLWL